MSSRKPAYKLVIVESPAKARTISKFLGRTYKVEASNGHVRDLPKSQLGVDVENGFDPKYITIRGRGEVLEKIRKEAKGAKSVILATDPDREGEAISWHLAHILGIDPQSACRVEFNEITEKTVKSSIKTPRKINMELVDAQQARRVLDRLVGYKISPLLWAKIKKGLSAGRVQSVATRMIVDREQEIETFEPEEYWHLSAKMLSGSQKLTARLHSMDGKRVQIDNAQSILIDKNIRPDSIKSRQRVYASLLEYALIGKYLAREVALATCCCGILIAQTLPNILGSRLILLQTEDSRAVQGNSIDHSLTVRVGDVVAHYLDAL